MSTSYQLAPFTHRALEGEDAATGSVAPLCAKDALVNLLPASARTPDGDLRVPGPYSVLADIDAELDLQRLADIHDLLWIAGSPMPPRPLHHQRLLNREIVLTERLDLHLVWGRGRMFVKPLPRFLLEPRFWEEHLRCGPPPTDNRPCTCRGRRERALGFLLSYAALITHESDFYLAKQNYLLPPETQWQGWRAVVREVLDTTHIYSLIDPRFHYGELRLSRLNKIYFLWKTPFRSYMARWNQYRSFFDDNFALLASSTVYVAIVLTAMQVGQETELQGNSAFQSATYGFTVFSILGPLVAVGLILMLFLYVFVGNWIATRRYWQARMKIIKGWETGS